MKFYTVDFLVDGENKWTRVEARSEKEARFIVYNSFLGEGKYIEVTRVIG